MTRGNQREKARAKNLEKQAKAVRILALGGVKNTSNRKHPSTEKRLCMLLSRIEADLRVKKKTTENKEHYVWKRIRARKRESGCYHARETEKR